MITHNDLIRVHLELEAVNNDIIKQQEEQIKLLEEHIIELREIIEKYLLKDVKL
jgi:hypothetical protein